MEFYRQLRLDLTGSETQFSSLNNRKDKTAYIARIALKVIMLNAVSLAVVFGFCALFGTQNFVAGVAVLLCMQLFRLSDLGMQTRDSIAAIFLLFALFAAGPAAAARLDSGGAFAVHAVCIFLIVLIGCHNVARANQMILVLSYLLLAGFPAGGDAEAGRIGALSLGSVLCAGICWRARRGHGQKDTLKSVLQSFRLTQLRSRWQVRFAVGVASAMFLASLTEMVQPVWAGIAALPVMMPQPEEIRRQVKQRAILNGAGCAAFLFLYFVLPEHLHTLVGTAGSLLLGIGAASAWIGVTGVIAPLSLAVAAVGFPMSVIYRIAQNFLTALYAWGADRALEKTMVRIAGRLHGTEAVRADAERKLAVVE